MSSRQALTTPVSRPAIDAKNQRPAEIERNKELHLLELDFLTVPVVAITINITATIVALLALTWRSGQLRGTTLVAPWYWALAAIVAVGGVEMLATLTRPGASDPSGATGDWWSLWRQMAAPLTLCPAAALIGAKRPQDRPWQFVVFSLWLVVCLPAVQSSLFVTRSTLIETIWNCFVTVVLLAGLVNHLGTRFWLAALLWFAGQLLLLAPRLPLIHRWDHAAWPTMGLLLLACSLVVARCWPRPRVAAGWDRVWREWRDAYGVLWGLRVAERFNATAKQQGWRLVLHWAGFAADEPAAQPVELPPAAVRTFRMLLRRFVPPEWIVARMKD